MKKTLTICMMLVALCFVFTACKNEPCMHKYDNDCDTTCNLCEEVRETTHDWKDADCLAPKTCTVCGETEGELLDHDWEDATCTAPKTCTVCGETEGELLDHDWEDATCIVPKTCTVCGETEGELLDHDWEDATCTLPKTCTVCGATEGDPIPHDYESEYTISEQGHYKKCICHPELDEVVPHEDLDEDYSCDDCGYLFDLTYTIAMDVPYENVTVTLINEHNEQFTAMTDANGVATLELQRGEYRLEIKHYNTAYIWRDKDNSVTVSWENPNYTASFDVTTEQVEYIINVYNPDGSIHVGGNILVYDIYGVVEGALGVNSRGQAITYMPNDDYIISIYGGGEYAYAEFEKDGPTTITVTLKENSGYMTAENPVVIYDLINLPFMSDYIESLPFDNSYDFEAGESIYVLIPYANKKVITFGSDKISLEYGGTVRELDSNNSYEFVAAKDEAIVAKLTASEACTEDISVSHPGSRNNEYYVNSSQIDGYTKTVSLFAGETVYFMLYTTRNNNLEVTAANATVTINGESATQALMKVGEYNRVTVTATEDATITITFTATEVVEE